MMRLVKQIVLLSACISVMAGLTGCARLTEESYVLKNNGHPTTPPPKRFYLGSVSCVGGMAFGPAMFGWGGAALIPLFIIDLPLELAMDTVFLPKDIYLYVDYKNNPPLSELVKNKQYDELEKQLKAGAPMRDWRSPDGRSSLEQALYHHDTRAYEMLLKYGAQPTEKSFKSCSLQDRDIIRLAAPYSPAMHDKNTVVHQWLEHNLDHGKEILSSEEQEALIEIIQLLLKNGFPDTMHWEVHRRTSLDIVLETPRLSEENRRRLADVLRLNGSKTYQELVDANPRLPHLHTEGLDISPIYKAAIDILKKSYEVDKYVLSTQFANLDVPVLVIQKKDDSGNTSFRQRYHRRETATRWSQKPEFIERPAWGWRLVLTPKGTVLPSRIPEGMPKGIMQEAWFTSAESEAYYEFPGYILSEGAYMDSYINKILRLYTKQNGGFSQEDREKHSLVRSEEEQLYSKFFPYQALLTDKDKKWLAGLAEASKSGGFAGNWICTAYSGRTGKHTYVYDAKGRFGKKTEENLLIIPEPDEMICTLAPDDYTTYKRYIDKVTTEFNSKDGISYWNCREANESGYTFYIFFGDEVPMERVDAMQRVISEFLEDQ